MDFLGNPENLKLLQDLVNPTNQCDSSDSEDETHHKSPYMKMGPGNIGAPLKNAEKNIEDDKKDEPKKADIPFPDDRDEVDRWMDQQIQEDAEILDTRKRPEYKIVYKQAVGTEDLYLQMGNKSAATHSCEDMVIEIFMPDETVGVEDMDLSVTDTEIDLKSPIYRLKLPLMQKIDPDRGTAKFDPDTKSLILTLRMRRELDFVNF